MPVVLQANALVDPTDPIAARFLKLAVSSDDLITLINRGSDYCEGYANRPLKKRTFTAIRLGRQTEPRLRPLATPIDTTQTVTLTFDEIALPVWRTGADGFRRDFEVLVGSDTPGEPSYFRRACGWWSSDEEPIQLTFTGGLATIPGDLQQACLLVCQTLQRQEKGASEVQSYGQGPVSQSVTYRADSLIPMWSKQVLDRYRVVPL